ncbi:hypothetical protein GGR52DRAFT_570117 [Hypoxylon sp. FL1284]|nr:hypothetical protein GGR52DRAFT_570117 [Hypoxylon sp. FL1284]
MSALSVIDGLLVEAEKLIKSRQPPPTRGDYAEALERMDAAMELIAEGGCSAGTLGRCAAIQRKCNAFLRRSYSRTESKERRGKNSEAATGQEHSIDRTKGAGSPGRKIRFVDEAKNEPNCPFGFF